MEMSAQATCKSWHILCAAVQVLCAAVQECQATAADFKHRGSGEFAGSCCAKCSHINLESPPVAVHRTPGIFDLVSLPPVAVEHPRSIDLQRRRPVATCVSEFSTKESSSSLIAKLQSRLNKTCQGRCHRSLSLLHQEISYQYQHIIKEGELYAG